MKLRALCLLLLSIGCGSDPTAPGIENLTITPPQVKAGENLSVVVDYEDPDFDIASGKAELALRRVEEPQGQTFEVQLGGDRTSRGRIVITVKLPGGLPPGMYELGVTLVDGAGRRSNSLLGSFEIIE